MHYLERKGRDEVIFLIHGNASSSVFWKDTMSRIPSKYRVIAPDMRGFGNTEDVLIDATRGFLDFVDDIIALADALDIQKAHFVGHSLGGGILWSLLAHHPERIRSISLVNPASPFGFGGTKGLDGQPCAPDFAGTGGGVANPEFARRIKEKDRSSDDPNASPRVVMNSFYWKPPFQAPNEDELLESVLSEKIGDDRYPGDFSTSENWPFVRPGKFGPVNAASPKYVGQTVEKLLSNPSKPPVLWIRGSHDLIVSDESLFDMGTLGKMGLIPGYPGEKIFPPQPMISQIRTVLQRYQDNGGFFVEHVMNNTGHSPYIEQPDVFMQIFMEFTAYKRMS